MPSQAQGQSVEGAVFQSADVAEQWRKARSQRQEIFNEATNLLLNLVNVRAGDRILEIAAGTGEFAVAIAQVVGPSGHVLATDISPNMVELARQTAREAGVGNLDSCVMDAENLTLEHELFNGALCRMGLMLFANPMKALSAVHRVLRAGGKFGVIVFASAEKNPYFSMPLSIARRIGKLRPPEPGRPGMFALGEDGVLEDLYKKAGFHDLVVRAVRTRRNFRSTAEAISLMKSSFPVLQDLLAKLSEPQRARAWSEIENTLRKFEGANGFEAPAEALIAVGTK